MAYVHYTSQKFRVGKMGLEKNSNNINVVIVNFDSFNASWLNIHTNFLKKKTCSVHQYVG